ncbi:hypothetical protein ONR75_10990 [Rhodopseudomonas sp. P2A-2r]|uniref:hypothetical protein n=1 Tax=Rhodopseudomonas sp. P2A-2r TaxID=2991972 RepID=UPI0022349AAA|nr:hypothetical protein [Rhodopseudomonas sp. P2A-2r]UZE51089.1 hypothetical protein ONR75_10990 [Rhodopseudomonas sp. P2A-2r]
MNRYRFLLTVLAALLATPAFTDELRPGYLEMRQTSPGAYDLLFKIPARGMTCGSRSTSNYPRAPKT